MSKIISTYTKLQAIALSSLIAIVLCFSACQKEKLDERKDNRFTPVVRPLSTARIVNLGGYNQVFAAGVPLTDTTYHAPNDPNGGKIIATDYFPKTGRLGSTWQIPQDLLGTNNSVDLKFTYVGNSTGGTPTTLPSIKEELNKPMDYYVLPTHMAPTLPRYAAIPRGVVQPSKPDHFKIRIINLSAPVVTLIASQRGTMENLAGPVTLTYADGTSVSTQTNGITVDQRTSDYIELPYGTYQFKVLTANGRQIPGASPTDGTYSVIDPPTSNIGLVTAGVIGTSKQTFAPIQTYQPGGVYSIVVTPYSFNFYSSGSIIDGNAYQNAYHVITDVSAPVNNTYCRVQAANAMPGSGQVSFRLNKQELSAGVNYGEASAYGTYILGNYTIEAVSPTGEVLATSTQTFRPEQNYTIWLYPDAAGKAKILFVPNDLSGFSAGSLDPQDGSSVVFTQNYLFKKMCLNLSLDNPYISFTFDNGQQGIANMQPGILKPGGSYVTEGPTKFAGPFEMMAYRSTPDVIPGTWAKDIDVLKSSKFIARPDLYTAPGRPVPDNEPGVFTVALIGRSAAGTPAADKAKFIIVKHNR